MILAKLDRIAPPNYLRAVLRQRNQVTKRREEGIQPPHGILIFHECAEELGFHRSIAILFLALLIALLIFLRLFARTKQGAQSPERYIYFEIAARRGRIDSRNDPFNVLAQDGPLRIAEGNDSDLSTV